MGYIAAVLLGYLLGCSNLAFFLAKLRHVNLRAGGSGNLGASNATLLMGWRVGALVCLHDIGKSLLAVVIAQWLFPETAFVGAVAGVAAVLGHIFPFYLRFRGGKGLASYLGMTLALNWKIAIVVSLLLVLVTIVTDYIVCGTVTTIVLVPVCAGIVFQSVLAALILLIATAVIGYKHRENYVRIWNRTEIGLRSAIRGDHRERS